MRSSTPRVRTGCLTCRKRHVKCDETRPSCDKCTRAGWKCDGYALSLQPRPSRKAGGKATVAKASSGGPELSIASYAIPFRIPGAQKDRQMLHYFCVQGSDDIAGYVRSEFWSNAVLQQSHQEPVVRQALVALSSLHLNYATADTLEDGSQRAEALALYGKAMRALKKRIEAPTCATTRTTLVCCILFYCFESTLGDLEAAMHHLTNGLNILSHHLQNYRRESSQDITLLSGVFERLDLQATMFDDARVPYLVLTSEKDDCQSAENVRREEERFSQLEDASDTLIKLQNLLFHFLARNSTFKSPTKESLPPLILKEKNCMIKQFDTWRARFSTLEHRAQPADYAALGNHILLIHWQTSRMLLFSNFPTDESVFGASPNPAANDVIDRATTILQLTEELNKASIAAKNPRRNFSFDTGIIAPLFLLAMKCSDESVCNKATELLVSSRRREGLYDGQMMATVVNRFRTVMRQDKSHGKERSVSKSIEHCFANEIDSSQGGMNRLADNVIQWK
ncbi:hypothetical protein F5X98DRAFT_71010 [Xylaria grammica]|nr:hypothetical protein F5X98DRAFT_71010 [Xylaria grammica]